MTGAADAASQLTQTHARRDTTSAQRDTTSAFAEVPFKIRTVENHICVNSVERTGLWTSEKVRTILWKTIDNLFIAKFIIGLLLLYTAWN